MTGSELSSRSRLNACRVKPTQAKPRTTLFGSNMEQVDVAAVKSQTEMVDLDEYEKSLKPKPQVRNPPPKLAAEIKDPAKLASAREQVEARKKDVAEAREALTKLETQALYRPGDRRSDVPLPGDQPIPDRPHQWMTAKDLAHASSINVLGVDPKKPETYNRDWYEKGPPVHKYELNGDLLNRGQQRERRQSNALKMKTSQINVNEGVDDKMYVSNYQKHYGEDPKNSESEVGVNLPKNIEHLYGTKICQKLLADKEKVALTLEQQASVRARHRRERTPSSGENSSDVKFTMYEDLGNALRHDHFPGFSTDNQNSTTKEVYTQDVHKNHVRGPDQWRYQRDELSNWLDAIVIQNRLKNAGKEAEQRPKPAPIPKVQKPAKRPRKASTVVPDFEPVHFETPPRTPQKPRPRPEDLAKLPDGYEKDQEFWNYYDKGAKPN